MEVSYSLFLSYLVPAINASRARTLLIAQILFLIWIGERLYLLFGGIWLTGRCIKVEFPLFFISFSPSAVCPGLLDDNFIVSALGSTERPYIFFNRSATLSLAVLYPAVRNWACCPSDGVVLSTCELLPNRSDKRPCRPSQRSAPIEKQRTTQRCLTLAAI